ncbi:MAG: hypothetical protein CMO61_07180 [Verrucomicrobiales bacterium]|jgi:type II secretory pathway component PulK|nr:hypothetical protein [Verrucomicrobiales bacterium]|tara:strand:+ start:43861 stop:44787 length:927 start_codon:yes stop_codon:yes gene_type:complete
MMLLNQKKSREKGMALLLVLVTVMALVLIIGSLWEASQPGWEENDLDRIRYKAGLLAESGFALALHPEIEPGDLALQQGFGPEQEIRVLITSEGGRIPVNRLGDERWRDAIVELLVLWGLDAANASIATDSLADWIDTDNEMLSNGAENAFYSGLERPEFPTNLPFTSLEQMLFVQGMDEVARFQPMWRDYFTIHSDELLDLNTAEWEVIYAITGTTEDAAMNFAAVRNGNDGIRGTVDDYRFEDLGEVQALLGLSDDELSEFSDLIALDSTVMRIESQGRYGDHSETRVMLARQTDNGWSPLARFRN